MATKTITFNVSYDALGCLCVNDLPIVTPLQKMFLLSFIYGLTIKEVQDICDEDSLNSVLRLTMLRYAKELK